MTKADLIQEVACAARMPQKEAAIIVETVFGSILRSVRTGEGIEIRGFGSFSKRQRPARIARNPKTGVRVEVPARTIPYFKPSRKLKDFIDPALTPTPPPAP